MTFDSEAPADDGRCQTCRQRGSHAGERDNGSWFCNVPGCANANAADDLAPDSDIHHEGTKGTKGTKDIG